MSSQERVAPAILTDAEIAALFPRDFLWGAATAAYQIEGAVREDGRAPSIWDYFAAQPGKIQHGDTGEIAADHYHRMREDVALMAELGLPSYRFSIAWPRILPTGHGTVNQPGLDFYERLVDTLLAHKIRPLATLYHWDLPLALHERGGWLERDTAYAFADYAEVVARRLGDRVDHWITLNEPWCSAFLGYGIGVHAPGLRDMQSAITASHHLLLGHGLALPRLRAHTRPQAQLGITLNPAPVYTTNDDPQLQVAFRNEDAIKNRWFLDPLFKGQYPAQLFEALNVEPPPIEEGDLALIAAPLDFLGVNYYTRTLLGTNPQNNAVETVAAVPGATYTEMGWEVYPEGLTDLLLRIQRDYAPPAILITENGAAFADQWDGQQSELRDPQRLDYLRDHFAAVGEAITRGVPVRGYSVWSLMDNFEWAEGYSKRFGIVYVDYASQRRIIKESGYWFANFLKARA